MSRPIVSYDDIQPPYSSPASQPPNKKHKKNNYNNQKQHWDDPKKSHKNGNNKPRNETPQQPQEEEDPLRPMSMEEIWDDSALIDAWDAANEEYEAYHGPGKDWKAERVNKSTLWYNSNIAVIPTKVEEIEEDSQPVDFETFVPTHDPSLVPPPVLDMPEGGGVVDVDEAFQRAMGAMYWTGYWSGMYHAQRHAETQSQAQKEEVEEYEDEEESEDSDLVSTQR